MSSWDAWLALAICAVSGSAAFTWLSRWYASAVQTTARSKAVKREFASYNRGRAPGFTLLSARNVAAPRFTEKASGEARGPARASDDPR